MKMQEIVGGLFAWLCMMSFAAGTGIILLYNRGDLFSHFVLFLIVFGTPFYSSFVKNQKDNKTVKNDMLAGTSAVLVCSLFLLSSAPNSLHGRILLSSLLMRVKIAELNPKFSVAGLT